MGPGRAAGLDGADILWMSFLFFQKSRSHANGKFIDLDPKQLCGGKMAELMDRDEQSKHKDS